MLPVLQNLATDHRVDLIPLADDNKFWSFAKSLTGEGDPNRFDKPLIALDPGETTGIAFWQPCTKVIYLAQLSTPNAPAMFDSLWDILGDARNVAHIRYEDYRVYGHMTDQHAFNHLHTPRVIGAIEVAAHLAQVPSSCCLAMHAKTFWTDDKLKLCRLYNPGLKHARDAERHLLRYMCERPE